MLLTARRLRLCARIFTLLLLVLMAAVGAAAFFLQRNSEALTRHFLDELSRETGLSFRVESVDVVFFPLPSLAVSTISVEGPDLHLSAAYATLRPDFTALLRGIFRPGDVSLLRPRLQYKLSQSFAELTEKGLPAGTAAPVALPLGGRLSIVQGEVDIQTADEARLHLTGLQCRLKIRKSGNISGEAQWTSARFNRPDTPPVVLDDFYFKGRIDPRRLAANSELSLAGVLRLPGRPALPEQLTFKTQFSGETASWTANTSLYGHLRQDGEELPFALDGTAQSGGAGVVNLQQLRLEFGEDSALLNATLRLDGAVPGHSVAPEALAPASSARTLSAGADAAAESAHAGPPRPRGPVLEGRLQIHRLSLTRWLGFARNLTPGLQSALDNVTDGLLVFRLDEQGLSVPQIRVFAAGSVFSGSGAVPRWKKPEVVLDLKAPRISLNLAVPEALGRKPLPVYFTHRPLTPMPGDPPQPGDVGVDYDIRLAGEEVAYGPLRLDAVQVVIRPGKADKDGLEDTKLTATARFYEGTLHGEALLGSGTEATYDLKLRLRGVNAKPAARALPVLPLEDGRVRADVEVVGKGRDTAAFLSSLRGSASVRTEQGALRLSNDTDAEPLSFQALDVGLKLRTAALQNGSFGLDGQWQGRLQRNGLEAEAGLTGMLWIGGRGNNSSVDFQNLPGTLSAKISPELSALPDGLAAEIRGIFSCRGSDGRISAADAELRALDMSAKGRIQVNLGGKAGLGWQGNLQAQIPDFSRTLGRFVSGGVGLPPPLRRLEVDAAFKGSPDELQCSDMRIRLNQSTVSGSLSLTRRKQWGLDFKLATDHLDLDKWFPRAAQTPKSDKKTGKGRAAHPKVEPSKAPGKPWDLRAMRQLRAKGELRVAFLQGWKFKAQSLVIPVLMENGNLTFAPVTGRLYGAALHSRGRLEFTRGLNLESSLSVDDFDLAAASADKGGAALSGRASVSSEISASLTGPGQMPKALNGRWNFSVRNGSYQTRTDDGALKGKVTRFEQAGASGLITAGIVRTDDFKLQSPELRVSGGGWIDLNTENIDCTFNVNMKGLPDFPLRLHGTLSDSKTTIGAGKLILNTLGGLTMGLFDVLGGVVEGTWRIFR